ncbi:MAG: gliding motility lipoprotein GldB [Flavobacteriaceae bacterium]|nr:gliding motility lipoprotein GldB [Flavobacteriaceae bacterium]
MKVKFTPFQLSHILKTIVFLMIICVFSCQNSSKIEREISEINLDLTIERFDQMFASSGSSELPALKRDYPFLFSKRYADSVWINRMSDPIQQLQNKAVDSVFQNFSRTESEIFDFYQHLKYYYKGLKTPRLITVLSDVDYRNKVVVTDSIVLIALDTYLGVDHEFYASFYDYIKQNLNKDQIVSDLATAYAERLIYQPKRSTFLEEMIYFGKQLYFKDLLIPFKEDYEKIGYLPEQYEWAQDNEFYIWQYFVENELLYETDRKLLTRFIIPAPFSRFNLELDSESPGRLGQYIGWKIVKSYMENNTTPLVKMLQMEATDIFKNAKFKPKK